MLDQEKEWKQTFHNSSSGIHNFRLFSFVSWKRLRDGWIPVKIRNVFSFITIVSQLLFHLLFSFIILSQEKKENKWKEVWWRDRDGFLDRASFSFSWKRFQPTARSSLRLIVMCCRLKPKRRNDFHGQESMIHVLTSSFSFYYLLAFHISLKLMANSKKKRRS